MADDTTKTPEEIKAAEDAKAQADAEAAKKAEEEKNKTVPHAALHAEREEHKKTKERLKALEDAQNEAAKKAEEEKGNFKKLYEDEQVKAKTLSEQLTGATARLKEFEDNVQKHIEDSLTSVKSEEDKTMIKKLLEGKTLSEQQSVLPKLLEKFGGVPANVNGRPKGDGKGQQATDDKDTQRQQAKEKNNVLGVIANSPALVKS